MKYRVVELILIWIICLVSFGKNKASPIYGRNTYKPNITYISKKHIDTTLITHILKKYLHTQHHVYILKNHIQTLERIYCIIYVEEVHTDINRSYINIHSNTRLELIICLQFYHLVGEGGYGYSKVVCPTKAKFYWWFLRLVTWN